MFPSPPAGRAWSTAAASVLTLLLCAPPAAADPMPVADQVNESDTFDGWHLRLSMTRMTIDAVPNMAAAPFVKEGFVTAMATATIDGDGSQAVNSGTLILGVQLGCKVALDDGLDLGIGNDTDVVSSVPYVNLSPDVSVTLKPGSIKTMVLGRKALQGRTGVIYAHAAHVEVDSCGGAVSVRVFAYAQIGTDVSDDSISGYGDLLRL